jgi:hypothetical protein
MLATETALSGAATVTPGALYVAYGSPADDGSGKVVQCPVAVTTAAGVLSALGDGSNALSTCDLRARGGIAAGPFGVGKGARPLDDFGT